MAPSFPADSPGSEIYSSFDEGSRSVLHSTPFKYLHGRKDSPSWVVDDDFAEGNALGLHNVRCNSSSSSSGGGEGVDGTSCVKEKPDDPPFSAFVPPSLVSAASSVSSRSTYLASPIDIGYASQPPSSSYFALAHGHHQYASGASYKDGPTPGYHGQPSQILPVEDMHPSQQLGYLSPSASLSVFPAYSAYASHYQDPSVDSPLWHRESLSASRFVSSTPYERAMHASLSHAGAAGQLACPSPDVVLPSLHSPGTETTLSPEQDLVFQRPAHPGLTHSLSHAYHSHYVQQQQQSYLQPCYQPGHGYVPFSQGDVYSQAGYFRQTGQPSREHFGLGLSMTSINHPSSLPPLPKEGHALAMDPTSNIRSSEGDGECSQHDVGHLSPEEKNAGRYGLYLQQHPPAFAQRRRFIKSLPDVHDDHDLGIDAAGGENEEDSPPLALAQPILCDAVRLPSPDFGGSPITSTSSILDTAEQLLPIQSPSRSKREEHQEGTQVLPGKRSHACEGCRKSKNRCNGVAPFRGHGPAREACTECNNRRFLCEFKTLNKRGMSRSNPIRIFAESQQRNKFERRGGGHGERPGLLPTSRQTLAAKLRMVRTDDARPPSPPALPLPAPPPPLTTTTRLAPKRASLDGLVLRALESSSDDADTSGTYAPGTSTRVSSIRSSAPRRASAGPSLLLPHPR